MRILSAIGQRVPDDHIEFTTNASNTADLVGQLDRAGVSGAIGTGPRILGYEAKDGVLTVWGEFKSFADTFEYIMARFRQSGLLEGHEPKLQMA